MIRIVAGLAPPWRDAIEALREVAILAREAPTDVAAGAEDEFGLLAVNAARTDLTVAPREEVDAAIRGDAPYPDRLHELRAIARITQPHTVVIGSRRAARLEDVAERIVTVSVAEGYEGRLIAALLARCGIAAKRAERDTDADLIAAIVRPLGPVPRWLHLARPFDVPREAADRALRELGVRTGVLRAGSLPGLDRDLVTFRLIDHVVLTHVGYAPDAAGRLFRALDENPQLLASGATGFGFHPRTAWRETAAPLHFGAMSYSRDRGLLR